MIIEIELIGAFNLCGANQQCVCAISFFHKSIYKDWLMIQRAAAV